MTKFAQKSFSVSCSSGSVDSDEMAKRWEQTFGNKCNGERYEKGIIGPNVCAECGSPSTQRCACCKAELHSSLALNAGTDDLGCDGEEMMPIEDGNE